MTRRIKNLEIKAGPPNSILAVLGVILIMLKIAGISVVATWSWWLVLLPFYIGLLVFFGFIALVAAGGVAITGLVFFGALVMDTYSAINRKIRNKKNNRRF
jgi:hypothetical protein